MNGQHCRGFSLLPIGSTGSWKAGFGGSVRQVKSWALRGAAEADLISACLKAKVTMLRIEPMGLRSLNWLLSKENSEQTIL